MASNTEQLSLLKKNPATDGSDTFNIVTMLNDNWDKLDAHAKAMVQFALTKGKPNGLAELDATGKIKGIPTNLETTTGAQQKIDAAIANLIDGAPGAIDTLYELAKALGDDPNFSTTVLNKITLIEQAAVAHKADDTAHVRYGIAGGTNAKTIALNPAPASLIEGIALSFKNTTANTGAATLNVNNLGAKSILKSNGSVLSPGNLKAGSIYTVRYDGASFILQGEGGEYGNVTAVDVLQGKIFGTEEGLQTGTLIKGYQKAVGEVTSFPTQMPFPNMNGTATNLYYITMPALDFLPNFVRITAKDKKLVGATTRLSTWSKNDIYVNGPTSFGNVTTGQNIYRVPFSIPLNIPVTDQNVIYEFLAYE